MRGYISTTEALAQIAKEQRLGQGLTQRDIAERAGVDINFVVAVEGEQPRSNNALVNRDLRWTVH